MFAYIESTTHRNPEAERTELHVLWPKRGMAGYPFPASYRFISPCLVIVDVQVCLSFLVTVGFRHRMLDGLRARALRSWK